nr:MORC family CW-type zinc finger protein 2B-like isoform X1 [Tanacetum cinerariifolium]
MKLDYKTQKVLLKIRAWVKWSIAEINLKTLLLIPTLEVELINLKNRELKNVTDEKVLQRDKLLRRRITCPPIPVIFVPFLNSNLSGLLVLLLNLWTIQKTPKLQCCSGNKIPMLAVVDNGHGMGHDDISKMVMFGRKQPDLNDPNRIGRYGVGFKHAAMGLGKDALVNYPDC